MPVHLDLRNLPPPEPMDRILDAVQSLRPGEHIEALTPWLDWAYAAGLAELAPA